MSEGERQALALRLYDDWQETDTSDSLEIYCYDKGRAEDIHKFISWLHETQKIDIHIWETLDGYADEYVKEKKK